MPDANRRPTGTLDSLTGLRFLAAAMVVLYHASMWSAHDHNPGHSPLEIGYVGVTFFFILSGFVLTWTRRPHDTPQAFWSRRLARIYPVHLLTFLVALVLMVLGLGDIQHRKGGWLAQLLLVQSWAPGPGALTYNSVAWSLSDEAFFYFLFPFLIGVRPLRRRPALLAALAGVWLIGGAVLVAGLDRPSISVLFWLPAYRIGEFLLGVALALAVRRGWRPRVSLRAGAAAAVASYLLAWLWGVVNQQNLVDAFWYAQIITAVGFSTLILAAALTDLDRRPSPLRSPSLVRLGQWSFALYMVHELGMRLVYAAGVRSDRLVNFLAYLAAGAASVGVAGAIYRWYERPLERRLRDALISEPRRPALERAGASLGADARGRVPQGP